MSAAVLCGAGFGLGVALLAYGLRPRRAPLSAALAALAATPATTHPPRLDGISSVAGRVAHRTGLTRTVSTRAMADLAVTGRPVERHLADKVTLAVFGLVLAPATTAVMAAGGVHVPFLIPAWAAVFAAVGGFVLPDAAVRADAARRRRQFRFTLSSYLDLVVILLAGGAGVDGALHHAAQVGDSWASEQIRAALNTARVTATNPWTALADLGDEMGVDELVELAAVVSLAGTEGARVRQSLAAKAASLRAHQLADAEADAHAATERMSLPVVVLFAGFLLFIGYPAMARVVTGL